MALLAKHTARDRRSPDRLVVPTCPRCQTSREERALSRTAYAVYFRCDQCGLVISETKPCHEQRLARA
jgi:hypothetical protein